MGRHLVVRTQIATIHIWLVTGQKRANSYTNAVKGYNMSLVLLFLISCSNSGHTGTWNFSVKLLIDYRWTGESSGDKSQSPASINKQQRIALMRPSRRLQIGRVDSLSRSEGSRKWSVWISTCPKHPDWIKSTHHLKSEIDSTFTENNEPVEIECETNMNESAEIWADVWPWPFPASSAAFECVQQLLQPGLRRSRHPGVPRVQRSAKPFHSFDFTPHPSC